jgi:hypothetical protein
MAYSSPAGLNDDAALTIITPSQMALNVRVLGVYLVDSQSGQSQLLAAPSDGAVAELRPPNQILYRGAFDSGVFQADLRYTYTKGGFESDVIVTRQPKLAPQDRGLNPATTWLQVRHQWQNAPPPQRLQQITLGQGTGTETPDQIIDLGELFFPCGRAFLTDGASSTDTNVAAQIALVSAGGSGADIPVGKEWQTAAGPGGSSLLLESVAWTSIAAKLAQLPLMAEADAPAPDTAVAQGSPEGPCPLPPGAICLAATPTETPGLVLDYITVGSSGQNQTFNTFVQGVGPTYLITPSGSGYANLSGTVTFEPGCVIKYQAGATLMLSGSVVCNGTQSNPSIFTSEYDGQYGGYVAYGTPATGDVNIAVDLYYPLQGSVALNGLGVRYANTAIESVQNCGSMLGTTVANCSLYECGTGLYASGVNVTINNSDLLQVTTPLTWVSGCSYAPSGSFGTGYVPAITVNPVDSVLEPGSGATFAVTVSPATAAIYEWCTNGVAVPGGTGPSQTLTVANPVDRMSVLVYVWNIFGYGCCSTPAYVSVLGTSAWAMWTDVLALTNTTTASLWTDLSCSDPAAMARNTSSLICGKTGFTAISQLNSGSSNAPCVAGQRPVTALTGHHGYMRGHGETASGTNYYRTVAPFMTVYFCNGSGNVVQVNVLASIVHNPDSGGTNDYSVLFFDTDVTTLGVTPMQVGEAPQSDGVILVTSQYAPAGVPGSVIVYSPPMSGNILPLYSYQTMNGPILGDSGSPLMVPTTDNTLVFIGGVANTSGGRTTGPCAQMQTDMNSLIAIANSQYGYNLNTNYYQMVWHATQ